MAKESSRKGWDHWALYFSLTRGTLNELQLLNLDQMNERMSILLAEWTLFFLMEATFQPHFFSWTNGGTIRKSIKKDCEKCIHNRENYWHLAGNRPEENSEKFILFQYLDLITHWFLKSTLWVKTGLQEDLGVECAFKTSIRLVMWWIPLVRWDYIDSSAQWVSPWVLRLDYLSSNPT